jgi:hypothetical protein
MTKAVSEHFEVYTTLDEAAAKAALTHFESARAYLLKSFGSADPFPQAVRIVAYKSSGEFRSNLPGRVESEHAFSKIDGDSVTIVVDGFKTYEYGMREYANLMLARNAPGLPYWLRMGLRDMYSTLGTGPGQIVLGREPFMGQRPDQSAAAGGANFLSVLFGLKPGDGWGDSAEAVRARNKYISLGGFDNTMRNPLGIEYRTEALRLVRLLMFDKTYSPKFGALVGALADGKDTTATIKEVYGQSLAELATNLNVDAARPSHPVATLKVQSPQLAEPKASQFSAAETAALVAEIKSAK